MRLLVVTTHWDLVGGSERYARDVVAGLRDRGFDVQVLCAHGTDNDGPKVHRLDGLDAGHLCASTRAQLRRWRGRVDRVLLLSHASSDLLVELLRIGPLVRFVQDHTLFCPGLNKQHEDGELCGHALGSECLRRYWLGGGCSGMKIEGRPSIRFPLRSLRHRLSEIELTRRAERVIVASNYMRDELLRCGFPPQQVVVLPYFTNSGNGSIAVEPLAEKERAFVEGDSSPIMLCAARLTLPDKGVDFLLTALGKLRSNSRLLIAGDGPARSWLESKAIEERLGNRVHFAGWQSAGQMERLYGSVDLLVCPSVWNEPFGLVGIEAMAHQVAVVAFDCGGIGEWLEDGVTGKLGPRKDTERLATLIEEALEDEDRRRAYGLAGKARVELRFRPERHLDLLGGWLTA